MRNNQRATQQVIGAERGMARLSNCAVLVCLRVFARARSIPVLDAD